MQNFCRECGLKYEITNDELKFLDKISPVFDDKKYQIPLPQNCPDCRLKGRTVYRNEKYFYQSKSAMSGSSIISLYSPDTEWGKKLKVYSSEEWWSDKWDAEEYGVDFDFNRPFFEQFQDLNSRIPLQNLIQSNNENCPYTTGTGYSKNCHLICCSEYNEDCYYGKMIQSSRDIMDSSYVYNSELLYECFNVDKCYNCKYLSFSQDCRDCMFSENLHGCKNCFLCTNLVNKEYYFMNRACKKDEYEAKISEYIYSPAGINKALDTLKNLEAKRSHKYADIVNCENCSGDMISNSRNCADCYEVNDSEDCKYVVVGVKVKDLMDCSNMYIKPELCYQVMGALEIYNVIFGLYIFHGSNVMYSQNCWNCSDLFGCAGLRNNKRFYIFNKKYTEDEYKKMVPKIIEHMRKTGEWGKMFPSKYSPFGYNETVACEYLPIKKEEAIKAGYKWKDKDIREFSSQTYIVPEEIRDVKDEILNDVLACKKCGKNFRIIQQELNKLRNFAFPIPKNCPECRGDDRMAKHAPRKLYARACAKCSTPIQTTYSPARPETVYCETCYLKELY